MFSGSIFPHWRRKAAQRSNNFSSSYEVPFFMNAAYYANWRIYRKQPPSSLRLGFISHIFYAFAWVKEDGTVYVNPQTGLDISSSVLHCFSLLSIIYSYPADELFMQLSDEWADSQMPVDGTNGCLRAFTQLKAQYSKMKVILSVGGGGKGSENFAAVARSQTRLETFVRTAKGLVDEFGLDGIDIDWEHPSSPAEGSDYVRLLARLRDVLPSPRYVLATCLPAGEWALRNIDLCKAQNYVDLINIMAYDFSGPWTNETGHQSQLYSPSREPTGAISCQSAIAYVTAQGVNPKKVLLGIPAYGRSFLGSNHIGQRYSGCGGEDGVFDYCDLPRPGAKEYYDEKSGAAWCVGGDGGFVTYDTPETVQQKAKFATKAKLGGLFYWHIGGDARGPRSLIETGYKTLHDM